jgi:hypothetical protein
MLALQELIMALPIFVFFVASNVVLATGLMFLIVYLVGQEIFYISQE